jgi:hypothetical protein
MAGSLGVLIISAFTADAAAVGAATIVGSLTVAEVVGATALIAANFAISSALAPGSSLSPQKQEANLKQTVAPRRRYYGVNKVGGTYVFWRATDGKFYLFLDLVDDTITGFDELYIDNNVVTLDGAGFVTAPTTYTFGGIKRVQVITQLGTVDQASLAILQAAFPGIWTADHRLRGVATALVVAQTVAAANFNAVYPQGIPQFQAVARCALVYDPRDGAQSWDDPTTWQYSDNYALCLLDYLVHPDGLALPKVIVAPALADWAARADDCDVQVALADGGTEARFRLWGGYELSEARKTVLQRILDASGGMIVQRNDGAPILRLPGWMDPADMVTLTDEHISTFSTLRPGPDMGERYNEIRANVVLRETGFQEDEAQPWRNEAAISAEGLQTKLLDLTMAASNRQARVRMKIEAYRSNPKWLGTCITNAYGMNVLGEPFARLRKTSYSFDEVVEPTDFPVDPNTYSCGITFRSMPEEAFAWSTDEEGTTPVMEDPGAGGAIDAPTGLDVTVAFNGYSTGVDAPQIIALVDDPGRDDFVLQAETRLHDGSISDDDAVWTAMLVAIGAWRAVSTPLNPDDYDLRARFQAASGAISSWVYVRSISA